MRIKSAVFTAENNELEAIKRVEGEGKEEKRKKERDEEGKDEEERWRKKERKTEKERGQTGLFFAALLSSRQP